MQDLRSEIRTERVKQLQDIARNLFAEQGFFRTTLDHIANRARVSKGTVYNYLGSKENIFRVLVAEGVSDLKKIAANSLRADAPLGQQVQSLVLMTIIYMRKNMDFYHMFRRLLTQLYSSNPNKSLESWLDEEFTELLLLIQHVLESDPENYTLPTTSGVKQARVLWQLIMEYVALAGSSEGDLLSAADGASEITGILFQGIFRKKPAA